MHFEVKGMIGGEKKSVRWDDGFLTGNQRAIDVLEHRAKLVFGTKIFPVAIASGIPETPEHLADPMKLIALLIYDTLFPAILEDGEITETDLQKSELPNSVIG